MLESLVARLSRIPGVVAVVLGGSRARGTHTDRSDYDVGLYYRRSFDVDALRAEHDVTPIGGWGPWINGGGWLTVEGAAVDVLYRDLDRVERVIDDCTRGIIEAVYQPGHPHAFVSAIYMGEIAICEPLLDPHGTIATLKARTRPYPPALREAIERAFGWEADFCVKIAEKALPRGDAAYVTGCCFRGAMCILQVLFARNGEYWLNEKGAAEIAERWISGIRARIETMMTSDAASAVAQLRALVDATSTKTSAAE
jgi:hypothetical protein